jgi:hypothetical protein
MRDFRRKMREKMALLKMDEAFASRYVNDGFSGGEKKRLEMLQMAVLEPEMAILDETDSGLDIDALRIVAEGVNAMLNPKMGVLLITHYQRLLNYIKPDVVHVLAQGRIVKTGGKDLALRLEDEGYGPILREAGPRYDVPTRPCWCRGRARSEVVVGAPWRSSEVPATLPGDGRCRAGAADPRGPLDPTRSGRLPDPPTQRQRPPAGLPRLGVHQPEAARRHRRLDTTTTASTTPTSTAGSTRSARGDRGLRAARAKVARSSTRPIATRSSSPATRPRRSTSSRIRGAGGTSAAATRSCSPRWSTTPTSCRGSSWSRRRTATSSSSRSPMTGSCASTSSRSCSGSSRSSSRSPTSATRWAPSTRSARWSRWPTPPAPSS